GRVEGSYPLAHARPCLELGAMALVVIEAHRLDAGETLECPRQAYRRILPAGEQDERAVGISRGHDDGSRREWRIASDRRRAARAHHALAPVVIARSLASPAGRRACAQASPARSPRSSGCP